MDIKRNNYYSILFFGVVFFAIYIFFEIFDNTPLHSEQLLWLDKIPFLILLLYAVLIAPIFEEFVFRKWQKKIKRNWILPIFFLVYPLLSQNYWLSIIAASFVFVYWVWYNRINTTLIVWCTTIVFALLHLPSQHWENNTYILLTAYLGMGLILSWIRLRLGLFYSILVHFLWNSFALIAPNIDNIHIHRKPISFNTDGDTVSMIQQSVFEFSPDTSTRYISPNLIKGSNFSKADIIQALYIIDSIDVGKFETTPLAKYTVKIHAKGESLSKNTIATILNVLAITTDTTYKKVTGYTITLGSTTPNDMEVKNMNTTCISTDLKGFAHSLQEQYNVPFYAYDTTWLNICFDASLPLKQQIDDLHKRYNITFAPVAKEVRYITFTDK